MISRQRRYLRALWRTRPVMVLLVACGLPRDADGTLGRVRGHLLRVGFAVDTPWTTDSAGVAGGVEGRLVRTLSHQLDTQVEWVHGQQGALLQALRHRDLDLVVGGIGGSSPWATQVGFTRPYYTDTVVVGGAPGASPPADVEHLRVAIVGGDATAAAVRGKSGIPVVVRDLGITDLPVAAPTWRLAQLRRRPNTALVLLQETHVLAAPPGENAWLVRLEQLLITEQDTIAAILRQLPR